jgi:hypothetical protein
MKLPSLAALLITISAPQSMAVEPSPAAERTWTGANGASFRGTYSRSLDQGARIEFLTSAGKIAVVNFGNLSKKDQEVILAFEKGPQDRAPAEEDFADQPIADRLHFPEKDPKAFGANDDESIVDALWISFLWWDTFKVVPIPEDVREKKKEDWLHKELTRHISKGGRSAASLAEAREGVDKYFTRHLAGKATCKSTVITTPLSAEQLAKLAAENDLVILTLAMNYSNGRDFSAAAVLAKMDADGTFAILLFGNRFTGRLEPAPHRKSWSPEAKSMELVLNDRQEMPEHYLSQGARFYINDASWTGALHLTPFVYKPKADPQPPR